jgi:antitoxin CcdA
MNIHTKKRTNVSIDAKLLEEARKYTIKLSPLLEQALRRQIRKEASMRWLAENKNAIAEYNKDVEERGVFSEGMRSF